MSWPSNANAGHDWLLDEWPWDPLSLGLALDWAGGHHIAQHSLNVNLNSNSAHALPRAAAEAPGRGGGAPGGGAQPRTRKRDRRGSRPRPAGGHKQALVCHVLGCGVALDSMSSYCKRTR
jgi:hypothetical protein